VNAVLITREHVETVQGAKQMAAEKLIPRAAMSMGLVDPAGAAPSAQEEWLAIDWQAAHLNVRRLQARIVKATQEGRWGRVKALQRLLTHSYSAKVLAVVSSGDKIPIIAE
jgi:hypothetical protein